MWRRTGGWRVSFLRWLLLVFGVILLILMPPLNALLKLLLVQSRLLKRLAAATVKKRQLSRLSDILLIYLGSPILGGNGSSSLMYHNVSAVTINGEVKANLGDEL